MNLEPSSDSCRLFVLEALDFCCLCWQIEAMLDLVRNLQANCLGVTIWTVSYAEGTTFRSVWGDNMILLLSTVRLYFA